jgi:hypothetical protein
MMQPDGEEDTSSLHAGCPVIKGTKWSATKWMHVGKFGCGCTFREHSLTFREHSINFRNIQGLSRNIQGLSGNIQSISGNIQ